MQKYKKLENLSDSNFRRLTGVKRKTFEIMVKILSEKDEERQKKGGRKRKLSIKDCLLLSLEYLREYRTYFHLSIDYGVSESQAQRIHRWVEKTLISDKRFHLPNKKELLKTDSEIEVILVDATESPVERPKKNKN